MLFQSQVAILFGGYVSYENEYIHQYMFQSQVAILFGGYYNDVSVNGSIVYAVSIAGGDSFWGLPAIRMAESDWFVSFNRRWRFFLGATYR